MKIITLTEDYLDQLDDVGSKYKKTIGFLTKQTLREYLVNGTVFGAISSGGMLVGFLLYAKSRERFRISQLCVVEEFRGQSIARKLISSLIDSATTQKWIKLSCRRDFPANDMWNKLGFVPLGDKVGRSRDAHLLTIWCYNLTQDDELGLWNASSSDQALDVVIDAHIFYDFDAPETTNTLISKGLLNDFLVNTINIWITDELFVEIHRQKDDEVRIHSQKRAHGFDRISYDKKAYEKCITELKTILPYSRESEKSDIHHIAKTAASEFSVFVTKDEDVLKKSEEIKRSVGVELIHPVDLITDQYAKFDTNAFCPSRVSGVELRWSRLMDLDVLADSLGDFQEPNEKKGKLLELIGHYLVSPTRYTSEILVSGSSIIAIRVLSVVEGGGIHVNLLRVSKSQDIRFFSNYICSDNISRAIKEGKHFVLIEGEDVPIYLERPLSDADYVNIGEKWFKYSLCEFKPKESVLSRISQTSPEYSEKVSNFDAVKFDRFLAPAVTNYETNFYLMTIRPSFAMGLIDKELASDDLFGGNLVSLLRWENIYYRANSHSKMLQAPGRILWYESGEVGALTAISHLDQIVLGPAKELFKKYQKLGVYEWKDLYDLCKGDQNKEIMAVLFSRTIQFKKRVDLNVLKRVYSMNGKGLSLQSSTRVPHNIVEDLYNIGMNNK